MTADQLSSSTARYTRQIVTDLERRGVARRPNTSRWRNRLHNAARKGGLAITTTTQGDQWWRESATPVPCKERHIDHPHRPDWQPR